MPTDNLINVRKAIQQYAYAALQLHEAIARKAGFSGTDPKYLGFFLQKGALTAGELATLTGLSTGAVTGLIDRFEQKKLVKRERDPNDRRKVWIVPDTGKIMALLQPLYQDFQQATEDLLATFTGSERAIIEAFLQKSIALMTQTKAGLNT